MIANTTVNSQFCQESCYPRSRPLLPFVQICDAMFIWRNGNIAITVYVLQCCVPIRIKWCTVVRKVLTGRSTGSGFDLASRFSSLSSKRLCSVHLLSSWCCIYLYNFFITFFALPFSDLSVVGLALDMVD